MFNDGMKGISTLSFAIFESIKDVVEQNTLTDTNTNDVQFISGEGDIYIPFSKKYKPDNNFPLFTPGPDLVMGNMLTFQSFRSKYIDPNITTISYNPTISITSLIKQLADDENIYGVVIQGIDDESNFSINPLHPVTAFLITSGFLKIPENGKLHIFEWRKSKSDFIREKSNDEGQVNKYIKDYEEFFKISPDIIKKSISIEQVASINSNEIEDIIENPFVENIEAVVNISKNTRTSNDIENVKSILSPHQLIADGTISPYYGISMITSPTNDSIVGYALGPMATGNISLENSAGSRTFESWSKSGYSCNVCTGSYSSSTPKGWFSLSRVNLNSMYYSSVISKSYVFPFIKASKKIAGDIWDLQLKEELQKLEENV